MFGFRKEITDPDLGELKFEHHRWCGHVPNGVPILLRSARGGPDATLRRVAVNAIRDLADIEAHAREYLRTTAKETPWPGLNLAAIEVFRPVATWVRHEISDQQAKKTILSGVPVVSLEFEIAGDRNVVDVILLNGVPVAWDYH